MWVAVGRTLCYGVPMTVTDRTAEQVRILSAAKAGRFGVNEHGRYVIDGESRPNRRVREKLMNDTWITWPGCFSHRVSITAEGEAALSLLRSAGES